jgi:MmyB-like transcription regulator ligand binding domain
MLNSPPASWTPSTSSDPTGSATLHITAIASDSRRQRGHGDWNQAADDTLALLRGSAARDPYDERLSNLIGELSTRSNDFRVRAWHRGWPVCRLPSGKRTPTAPAS